MASAELAAIATRTFVMLGGDDEVTPEHAVTAVRSLPRAELAVVPGTPHGLLVEKPDLCHAILIDFLTRDAVSTLAPRRRSSEAP